MKAYHRPLLMSATTTSSAMVYFIGSIIMEPLHLSGLWARGLLGRSSLDRELRGRGALLRHRRPGVIVPTCPYGIPAIASPSLPIESRAFQVKTSTGLGRSSRPPCSRRSSARWQWLVMSGSFALELGVCTFSWLVWQPERRLWESSSSGQCVCEIWSDRA